MPASIEESSLLQEAKDRSTSDYGEVLKTEVSTSFKEMPAGVEGIAQVQSTAIKKDKSGHIYWGPSVVCVEPAEHTGTWVPDQNYFPLNEQKFTGFSRSEEENRAAIVGFLRAIGAGHITDKRPGTGSDVFFNMLNEASTWIEQTKPFVKFETWEQKRGKRAGETRGKVTEPAPEGYTPPETKSTNEQAGNGYQEVQNNGTPFNLGNRVTTTGGWWDGDDYAGEITGLSPNEETAEVKLDDDGETYTIEFSSLAVENGRVPTQESTSTGKFKVGDPVQTTADFFGDGNNYSGKITSLEDGKAWVEFDDDGSTSDVPLDKLEKV